MVSPGYFRALQQQTQEVRYQFVMTELELAITFCNIALASSSRETVERNTENARKALQGASQAMKGTTLTSDMSQEVNDRIAKIHLLFEQLEQHHAG